MKEKVPTGRYWQDSHSPQSQRPQNDRWINILQWASRYHTRWHSPQSNPSSPQVTMLFHHCLKKESMSPLPNSSLLTTPSNSALEASMIMKALHEIIEKWLYYKYVHNNASKTTCVFWHSHPSWSRILYLHNGLLVINSYCSQGYWSLSHLFCQHPHTFTDPKLLFELKLIWLCPQKHHLDH